MSDGTIQKTLSALVRQVKQNIRQLKDIDGGLSDLNKSLNGFTKHVDNIENKIKVMRETVDAHSGSLIGIESTIGAYGDAYSLNRNNIYRLERRTVVVEDKLDISPPEEDIIPK